LFEPNNIEFNIYDENIKFLYINGVIDNCEGICCVKVPLYYKALYARFKPQTNGERNKMLKFEEDLNKYIDENKNLKLNELLKRYTEYIKSRGAVMFKGRNYYEGVYQYNLDQFLSAYIELLGGKVYPETQIGGGRIDLMVMYNRKEYLIEIKANIIKYEYEIAKRQIKEYIKRKGLKEGWLIIYSNTIKDFEYITEGENGIKLHIWFIKTNFENPSKAK
ncbi:transcriptional regulator, partial [Marinitoga sp. 1154]